MTGLGRSALRRASESPPLTRRVQRGLGELFGREDRGRAIPAGPVPALDCLVGARAQVGQREQRGMAGRVSNALSIENDDTESHDEQDGEDDGWGQEGGDEAPPDP